MKAERIHQSVIAGTWYPGDPEGLRRQILSHIAQAKAESLAGTLKALIVPHAGYVYSGGVAAHAYKLLEHQPFERVLIVAPSHRAYFKGISIYDQGGFQTPLGIVPLDHEAIDALKAREPHAAFVPEAEFQEHSLEIQLPFLQVMLKKFRLTPVIMGEQTQELCEKLSDTIASLCSDKNILLVASTDLSHFHPYDKAVSLDSIVLDKAQALDAQGLFDAIKKGNCEACGAGPMVTVMLAAKKLGADACRVLRYANSGDVTGDRSGVVGYMSAALFQTQRAQCERPAPCDTAPFKGKSTADLGLSEDEKKTLHQLAVQAIRSHCTGEAFQPPVEITPKLQELRGAFVSIHKGVELRGCIGMIEGCKPLHQTIRDMAVQAAFNDPRFCALSAPELDAIQIEISVLTPLKKVADVSEIEVGKHGLLIRKGFHSGLLLPQVAVEHGWDREEFLKWTCHKAGLPATAWKDPESEIYVFSADVF